MSSAADPAVKHTLTQDLDEAFNHLIRALNYLYTKSFHRLALQQFVLRHIFSQTEREQLPMPALSATPHFSMAEDLADGFLRKYAAELGWDAVYQGPRGAEDRDERDIGSDGRELRGTLEIYVATLLGMAADVREWCELYGSVLRGVGRASVVASGGVFEYGRDDGEVQSEPEDSRERGRMKLKPRRSKSLVERLHDFVNEDEETRKRRRREMQASDTRDRLSDDSRDGSDASGGVEGSESGSSGDGEGHQCQICGARFATAGELTDHFEVHEGDLAEPEESSGRP